MELDVGGRSHTRGQLGDKQSAADLLQSAVEAQLFGDGEHVDRFLGGSEALDSRIDCGVGRLVETFGFEQVADRCVGVLFEHECAEDSLFEVLVARHYATSCVV